MLKELGGTLFFEPAVRRSNPDYSIEDKRICTILQQLLIAQCKGSQIPESIEVLLVESEFWEIFLVESGILGFGIWNTAQNSDPTNNWNPESISSSDRGTKPDTVCSCNAAFYGKACDTGEGKIVSIALYQGNGKNVKSSKPKALKSIIPEKLRFLVCHPKRSKSVTRGQQGLIVRSSSKSKED